MESSQKAKSTCFVKRVIAAEKKKRDRNEQTNSPRRSKRTKIMSDATKSSTTTTNASNDTDLFAAVMSENRVARSYEFVKFDGKFVSIPLLIGVTNTPGLIEKMRNYLVQHPELVIVSRSFSSIRRSIDFSEFTKPEMPPNRLKSKDFILDCIEFLREHPTLDIIKSILSSILLGSEFTHKTLYKALTGYDDSRESSIFTLLRSNDNNPSEEVIHILNEIFPKIRELRLEAMKHENVRKNITVFCNK